MTIEAKVICDSIGEHSPRLTTFVCRYPKFIHGEFMTHRAFSRNASSSRAIPVSKNLEEVRSDELRASPVWWGREQKGMASGEELSPAELRIYKFVSDLNDYVLGKATTSLEHAKLLWKQAALRAADTAEVLTEVGAHKSIVNRILEPFLHINVVMTSCEPGLMNFWGLRLDRAAQPEIGVLAEAMWKAWQESEPRKLVSKEWHLPFIDAEAMANCAEYRDDKQAIDYAIKVSVARCARVSYLSHSTGRHSTIEEDLALYERLVGASPMHLSPAEHQATPDAIRAGYENTEIDIHPWKWCHRRLHGNLPGWIQYRKTIPGEAVAPLPTERRI